MLKSFGYNKSIPRAPPLDIPRQSIQSRVSPVGSCVQPGRDAQTQPQHASHSAGRRVSMTPTRQPTLSADVMRHIAQLTFAVEAVDDREEEVCSAGPSG